MTTCLMAGEHMYDLWLCDAAYACLTWHDSDAKLMAVPVYTRQGMWLCSSIAWQEELM